MEFWALGFALSIYFSLQLPALTPTCILLLVCVIFTIWLLGRHYKLIAVCYFSSGALAAMMVAFSYVCLFYDKDLLVTPNQQHQVIGEVVNHPQPVKCNKQYCSMKLRIDPIQINNIDQSQLIWADKLLLLSWITQQHNLAKGDVIEFTAKLNRPIGYENQFGFNFSRWAFSEGIYAKGSIKSDVHVLSSNSKLSQLLINKLNPVLSRLTFQAHLYPLIIAESGFLNKDEKEQLKSLGLSHLFAISGLHIGVLYLLALYLIRVLAVCVSLNNIPNSYLKLVCLGLVWAYVSLIDFPVSATRAACLLSIWLFVGLTKRNWRKSQIFAAMVSLTLLLHPPAILAIGWWLSIWAVAGIFLFIEYSSEGGAFLHKGKLQSLMLKANQLIMFQVFISVWMLPVTLYWFSGYSILGLWFNLFMTPMFALFVIPVVFVSVLLLLLGLTSWSIWLFQKVDLSFDLAFNNHFATELTYAWLNLSSALWLPTLILIFVLVCLKGAVKPMFYVVIGLFSFCLLINIVRLNEHGVKLTVLDVGQGTSIVFQQSNAAMIYDLGPVYPSGMSATELVVKPALIGTGVGKLDYIIVSHQDSDHTGDINALKSFAFGQVIETCDFNKLYWQQLTLTKLWPQQPLQESDNDNSCVVMVTNAQSKQKVLLTGDISRGVELQLVAWHRDNHIDLSADILFSPHHGSRTSSSYPFIKAVSPKAVVHTAGIYNHFGFPAKDVKQRYENMEVAQYSTSEVGQIDFYFQSTDKPWLVKFWRNELSPFWKKQNPFSFQ